MRIELETRRRSLLPLVAIALAALYLFGFVPLGNKAKSLDAPLEQAWKRLANSLGQTNATRLDFVTITNQFIETRAALATFENARKLARTRVELDEELRARLAVPFQLVDYDYESSRRMNELARLAKAQQVALEPAVFAGFPEQRADMSDPALLWAQLRFIESLLTTAINAKVATVHSIVAPLHSILTNAPHTVAELPVQIELTGPVVNVGRFLQTVPLRDVEIQAAGLPAAPTNKPALFIERILLRKQSPEKPDEVHLTLRAVGFVFRE